jgi:hypothetical protein
VVQKRGSSVLRGGILQRPIRPPFSYLELKSLFMLFIFRDRT